MSRGNSFNRILALVAVLATVLVMSFSTSTISVHIAHHCNDEAHCPVCSLILQCENNIKTIGTGLIIAVAFAIVAFTIAEVASYFDFESVQTTLVSQKVRLDS
ncbi:MAG: hypothetical protein K6F66_00805 [Pseudobutyrivibrio sp.]|nr:hypothetical protein [Pseudobutyrivibrio sp.]